MNTRLPIVFAFLAFLCTIYLAIPAFSQSGSINFTVPTFALVSYRSGLIVLRPVWNETTFEYVTVKLYSGYSQYCSSDNILAQTKFGGPDTPPYPGEPGTSDYPSESFIIIRSASYLNYTSNSVYFCVKLNDSSGAALEGNSILLNFSQIPATTSTSTTSSTSTSTTSSINTTSSVSSTYTTTIYTTIPSESVQVTTAINRASVSIPSLSQIFLALLQGLRHLF